MQPITIYTFDGTASYGGGFVGRLDRDEGGSYPQKLAYRLRSSDPNTWRWYPVDYRPETALAGTLNNAPIDTLEANINRATKEATADMLAMWALDPNHRVVLSGLSQGTFITGALLHEFRYGALSSKINQLISVINFGDACRPTGWTIPTSFYGNGVLDPGGHGAMGYPVRIATGRTTAGDPTGFSWSGTAFGQGLHANPSTLTLATSHMGTVPKYLSFCNQADSAATVIDNNQGIKQQKLARALLYGAPGPVDPPNTQTVYRTNNTLFDGAIGTLIDLNPFNAIDPIVGLVANFVTNLASPNSLFGYGAYLFAVEGFSGRTLIDQFMRFMWPYLGALGAWANSVNQYGINMVQQWSPFISGLLLGADAVNPHARYNDPYAYTSLSGTTASAVELAFQFASRLGLAYAAASAWSPTLKSA